MTTAVSWQAGRLPRRRAELVTMALSVAIMVSISRQARASDADPGSDWGSDAPAAIEVLAASAASFRPRAAGIEWDRDAEGFLWATSSGEAIPFWAAVNLPSGALIERMHFLYRTVSGGQLAASLVRRSGTTSPVATLVASVVAGAGSGTATVDLSAELAEERTIDNLGAQYVIEVNTPSPTTDNAFRGVALEWRRQVHPEPAFGRFVDVLKTNPQFRYIEALAAAGITSGCGPPTSYCPDQEIQRWQMAVFLSTALGLSWKP